MFIDQSVQVSNFFSVGKLPDPTGAQVTDVKSERFTVEWDEAKYVKVSRNIALLN